MPTLNTSVDQIFDALHRISEAKGPVGPADLARKLGLTMSTAHRLLVTLQEGGFAERDTTGAGYELGSRSFHLVHSLFSQFGVREASLPVLRSVAELTGETAVLDVRVGWLAVRMAGVEGWREIHPGAMIGRMTPLSESAGGRAVLGALGEDEQQRYRRWLGPEAPVRDLPTIEVGRPLLEPAIDGRPGTLAFVLRGGDRPVAALVLEGAGPLLGPVPPPDEYAELERVVSGLVRLLATHPEAARDPFADLDPDTFATFDAG